MTLLQQTQEMIRRYIAGETSRIEVERLFSQQAQAFADARTNDLNQLYGLASILFAELGYGHQTEAEVKAILAATLSESPARR